MTTVTPLGELTGDYSLEATGTTLAFIARHTLGSRVPGHFDEFDGTARLDGDDPAESSVRLTIRAASIHTGNRRRDDHLRTAFFDVERHPVITFVSTAVRHVGGTGFEVTGDLTIRGVTKPVRVAVELVDARPGADGLRTGFTGAVSLNRLHWGVNENLATKLMVGSKVTLRLTVAARRQNGRPVR
ncbi:YceI family protein [Amycolatopsis sp. EV170708-02-1]|uniref:YceI family protein n=1 Tax=Amycolatopsis sp. EV170708-02-1 TaxID=2919322 RepID=UPI001F0C7D87|nr:YceI family protein [Amycolatopsis sp. EV170708-02-1]UMP04814.1 YceI family protein [Amycolatopsis sp. EV170708-02-1]